MDFLESLELEKEKELQLLSYYADKMGSAGMRRLNCRKEKGRGRQFYVRGMDDKKPHYVKKKDYELLRTIIKEEIASNATKVLRENIGRIDKLIKQFKSYDADTISKQLSRACKEAIEEIGEMDIEEPLPALSEEIDSSIPSENPFERNNLKYPISNGLFVRSKSEAIIGEFLLAAGIPFRYEKTLDLVRVYEDEAGFKHASTERVFPDFTIYLPNGEIIIWEHEGLIDKMNYRRRNMRKLMLYFENGFYMPHNLIITMEGEKSPFDSEAVLRIVNGILKPLFR